MTPLPHQSASEPLCRKKVRFEENVPVVEEGEVFNEEKEEESAEGEQHGGVFTNLGVGDNIACPLVIGSMFSRSGVRSSALNTGDPSEESRQILSIYAFHYPPVVTGTPQECDSAKGDMSVHQSLSPIVNPVSSGGCLNIINSALECLESIDRNDK
mmetsp:Transcript_13715/g.32125  ORF Transcript_13715/g.32125 Transcript_13715/m.32125 type:complete len:156 (+) Transcript_13715:229-696(+)|eukprot:CAMPEP_0197189778 /NCGR_PEP_ID=MMETSP1423-20130617/20375_1 /TAXON_ID=476441 /ORGANISM="Pseudo-nitzschia heimii, Strain UNC1101" /LENGTH=155 /DNA_ID=CAMNT_0042641987 /DNA_START=200 /DNA_END=667 /DNA_ORIENTATION=-